MRENEKKDLQRLSDFNRRRVIMYWRWLLFTEQFPRFVRKLRPIHLIFPAGFAQLLSALFSENLFQFAVFNLVIVGLAISPSLFVQRIHWVK